MLIPTPPHPTHDLVLLVGPDRVAVVRRLGGETRLLVPLPPTARLSPGLYRRVLGSVMRANPPRRVLVAVDDAARGLPHAASVRAVARQLQASFGYGLSELPDLRALLAAADAPDPETSAEVDGASPGARPEAPPPPPRSCPPGSGSPPDREVPRH
jgi:hypothetical protein